MLLSLETSLKFPRSLGAGFGFFKILSKILASLLLTSSG